ncbi:hypothetical protein [Rhodoferax koreensis]|nr:hypothetical protein [Rhodoferax koreense]
MNTATHSPSSSRWRPALAAAWLCAWAWLALAGGPVQAQEIRNFPPAAMRGRLLVTTPPQVQLDGKADVLAPGARIRNTQNMLVTSAALVGQEVRVNYTRETTTGMLQEVWVLTDAEAALRRPGSERPWYNFFFGDTEEVTPK